MVPKLFRVALQVADFDQAATFYAKLLADDLCFVEEKTLFIGK